MRTKCNRDGFVQVLMNGDAAAGERGAQLTALELPDPVGEAHRVVARYYPLVLQREDQVEIFAAQRHKGGSFLTGRHGEALIEYCTATIALIMESAQGKSVCKIVQYDDFVPNIRRDKEVEIPLDGSLFGEIVKRDLRAITIDDYNLHKYPIYVAPVIEE